MNAIDYHGRLREVEDEALTNRLQLASHEKECAVRYAQINENINEIRRGQSQTDAILKKVGWALIFGMATILAKLVFG